MLAVYAARAKSSPGVQPVPSFPTTGVALPKPAVGKMRLLGGLKKGGGATQISGPIVDGEEVGRAE